MHKLLKEEVLGYLERDCDEFAVELLHKEWNVDKEFIRNEILYLVKGLKETFSESDEEEAFIEGYEAGVEDTVEDIRSFDASGDSDHAYRQWKKNK